MIVCHCHCVSDREIRALVRCGVDSADSVGERCGAGTACGGCRSLVHDIVRTERKSAEAGPPEPLDSVAA